MPSITARDMLKHDERLVWITAFHCSKLMRCIVASRVMPALLTSTSTGPSSASIALTPSAQAAKSPTLNLKTGMPVSALNALRGRVVAAVIGRDLVAGLLKAIGDGAADAARAACHHRHSGHGFLPKFESARLSRTGVPALSQTSAAAP